MRAVAVIGIGKTAFGAFADRDLRSLAVEAGLACLADAHVTPSKVEAYYLGNFAGPSFVGQNHLAPPAARAIVGHGAVIGLSTQAIWSRFSTRIGSNGRPPIHPFEYNFGYSRSAI